MHKGFIIFGALLLLGLFFYLSVQEYSGDVKNHVVWAQSLLDLGAYGFFERVFHDFAFPNYPPLAMALFAVSLKLYYITVDSLWGINAIIPLFPSNLVHFFNSENVKIAFLKLPAIIPFFFTGIALYFLTKRKSAFFLTIGNPALFYLSVVWGQIDLLPVAFLLFSLKAIEDKRTVLPIILLSAAILSKQTVIVFIPAILFYYLKQFSYKQTLLGVFMIILFFFLSYIPFYGLDIRQPILLYQKNFDLVAHTVSEHAFNLWSLLFQFNNISDESPFLFGITYQHIGYLLFISIMALPSLQYLRKGVKLQRVISFLLIISLTSFLVLTRMHERYLAPAVVSLIFLSVKDKRFIFGLTLFTVIYLANLYRNLFVPYFPSLEFLHTSLTLFYIAILLFIGKVIYYIVDFVRE